MKVMRIHTAIMAALFLLLMQVAAFAQDDGWISAKGAASTAKVPRGEARTLAIQDAQRNAVEQAIGVMVSSETLVENFVLIRDRILTRVEGYVRAYEVTDENVEDGEYRVTIRAQVEQAGLADDIAALAHVLPRMNYPTIVVTMKQKTLSQQAEAIDIDLNSTEQVLISTLMEKGFRIAEPSAREDERMRQANFFGSTDAKVKQAIELASHLAQVVVAVQVVMQDNGGNPYNERLHSYGALMTAKVYETVTGKVIASASAEANAVHHSLIGGTQKAAGEAAKQMADDISAKLVRTWLDYCYNDHDITLIVDGISFDEAGRMRESMPEKVKGIVRVNSKAFLKNRAELVIGWKDCNTTRLAKAISREFKKLRISEVQGNYIRANYGK
jgi:hypothetical protein